MNNVEATLALLKNGANKDMQDSKVSSWELALSQPPVRDTAGPGISLLGVIHLAQEWELGLKALTTDQSRAFVVVVV